MNRKNGQDVVERAVMGEAFGDHKRMDFFVRHLLGVRPPQWKELEKK